MNNKKYRIIGFLAVMVMVANLVNAEGRMVQRFDDGWKFIRQDIAEGSSITLDDSAWRSVTLPHDWGIESPFNPETPKGQSQGFFDAWGVGWYRKHFTLSAADKGRVLQVQFDGVFRNSEVWLNGHKVGGRPYGYVGFLCDLTRYANHSGDNVLSVRVDHSKAPSDRWYSGAGIYRHVWLIATDKIRFEPWGIFVTTPTAKTDGAVVRVRSRVRNGTAGSATVTLRTEVLDPAGVVFAHSDSDAQLNSDGTFEFSQDLSVSNPRLWSLKTPVLYSIRSSLLMGDRAIDMTTTPFGIREIRFEQSKGFFLNGEVVKFKGVDLHHDLGCLGAASLDRAWERRLEVLKSMGCNAIRTSHNPPAPELLDLCDRMGFLVIDEAFDKWRWTGGYYKEFFDQWWERDLTAMIERDRNHPSIVIWSVGNEVEEQGEPRMIETLGMLADHVRKLDASRPVTFALEPHCNPRTLWDAPVAEKVRRTLAMAEKVDLIGCNYHEQWYEDYHRADSNLLIVGTEAYPYYRGRGNAFAAYEVSNPWFDVVKNDYVLGQFLWAGIDYLGEAQAWPSKGWASSPIDLCGFRKPQSWYHQSVWSDLPMVHLAVFDDLKREPRQAPHWSWPALSSHWNFAGRESRVLRVGVFANCPEVELTLNGESLGRKALAEFPNRIMEWNIPYKPGVLKAVGFRSGQAVCEHELRTAGAPVKLVLKPDRTTLKADGQDLAYVEVKVVDKDGIPVPDAELTVKFSVKGPAILAGLDNGDLDSNESFQGTQRQTYQGSCLAVVRAGTSQGAIELQAQAEGLPPATCHLGQN